MASSVPCVTNRSATVRSSSTTSINSTPTRCSILVERIEDAPIDARLTVAGRFLPEQLHEVARLLDGQILDTSALAITSEEIVAPFPSSPDPSPIRWCRRPTAASNSSSPPSISGSDRPAQDPVAIVAHISRSASAAALQELDAADRVLVGLLARTPGVDQALLASLGGSGFVWRALEAGIPLAPPDHR